MILHTTLSCIRIDLTFLLSLSFPPFLPPHFQMRTQEQHLNSLAESTGTMSQTQVFLSSPLGLFHQIAMPEGPTWPHLAPRPPPQPILSPHTYRVKRIGSSSSASDLSLRSAVYTRSALTFPFLPPHLCTGYSFSLRSH